MSRHRRHIVNDRAKPREIAANMAVTLGVLSGIGVAGTLVDDPRLLPLADGPAVVVPAPLLPGTEEPTVTVLPRLVVPPLAVRDVAVAAPLPTPVAAPVSAPNYPGPSVVHHRDREVPTTTAARPATRRAPATHVPPRHRRPTAPPVTTTPTTDPGDDTGDSDSGSSHSHPLRDVLRHLGEHHSQEDHHESSDDHGHRDSGHDSHHTDHSSDHHEGGDN